MNFTEVATPLSLFATRHMPSNPGRTVLPWLSASLIGWSESNHRVTCLPRHISVHSSRQALHPGTATMLVSGLGCTASHIAIPSHGPSQTEMLSLVGSKSPAERCKACTLPSGHMP